MGDTEKWKVPAFTHTHTQPEPHPDSAPDTD